MIGWRVCRGVAKLVSRTVRDREAPGSSPGTPTKLLSYRMIKFFREIIGTPVLHFEDGSLLASVKDVIIHPDTGKLEAFWVKTYHHPFSYGILQTQDIAEWKKKIYVKGGEAIGAPADIIKIADILSQKRLIVGNRVRTDSGVDLGRVFDLDFDTTQYFLRHIHVQKSFLGLWRYQPRILSYDLILEVLPDTILIKDKMEREEKIKEPLIENKQILLDN